MRIQNEQSGSTSLFAQPLAIEAIPEQTEIKDQRAENGEQEQGAGTGIGNQQQPSSGSTGRNAGASRTKARSRRSRKPARGRSRRFDARQSRADSHNSAGSSGAAQALVLPPEAKRTGEVFFPTPKIAGPSRPSFAAWPNGRKNNSSSAVDLIDA